MFWTSHPLLNNHKWLFIVCQIMYNPLAWYSHDITYDPPNRYIIFFSLFLHLFLQCLPCARHRATYCPFTILLNFHDYLPKLTLMFLFAYERIETQQNKEAAAVSCTELHSCGLNLVICVISSFVLMAKHIAPCMWLNKRLMNLIYSDLLQTTTPFHIIFTTMLRVIASLSSLNHNVKIFFF